MEKSTTNFLKLICLLCPWHFHCFEQARIFLHENNIGFNAAVTAFDRGYIEQLDAAITYLALTFYAIYT